MNIKREIEIDDVGIYNKCLPVRKEIADYENAANTSAVKIEVENADIKQENDVNNDRQHLPETDGYHPVSTETEPNHITGHPTTLLIDKKQTQQRAYAPRAGGYKCVTCGDNFKWKKSLEEHTKKHETDDRQVATTSQSWIVPIKQELDHCETGDGQLATPNLTLHIKTEPVDDDAGCIHTERTSLDAQYNAQIVVKIKLESEAVATRATETVCDSERAAVLTFSQPATSQGYRCHICYLAFREESLLASHITTHEEKQFVCSVCGFVSVSENGLRAHGNSAHGSSPVWHLRTPTVEKLYEVSKRDLKVKANTFTANHLKKVHMRLHAKKEPYHCSICDFKTSQRGKLEVHVRMHTGEKPYECSVCDFKTARKDSLRDHNFGHTGEKPYECSVCNFKTTTRRNLTKHEQVHTTETPYHCSMCDYRTSRRGYLIMHIRTHTGEKPYACTVCEFKTASSGSFRKHKVLHRGEKPYRCSVCDFKTIRRRNLTTHKRTHTGEKPYKCSICDFKTAHGSALWKHNQMHNSKN